MLENQGESQKPIESDLEARQNIAGFFGLLLEIDKRLNPQLYQAPSQKLNKNQHDHNRSPDNSN